jgi:hypothetical protein
VKGGELSLLIITTRPPPGANLEERDDPRRPKEEVVDKGKRGGEKARNSDACMRARESDSTLQRYIPYHPKVVLDLSIGAKETATEREDGFSRESNLWISQGPWSIC